MKTVISNNLCLFDYPPVLGMEIKKALTIENPQYVDAVKMGRWTGDLEQYLTLYEQPEPGRLIVPRGFVNSLAAMAKRHDVPFTWKDETRELKSFDVRFNGRLRDYQERAVSKVLRRRFGVLEAPTGSGKTVMALSVIAKRRQPTIILVHTRTLAEQWQQRVEQFLGTPATRIGVIGNGRQEISDVTVATVQSLYKIADQIKDNFGQVVVDECHRCPSRTFTEAVTAFDTRFMLGLSATPFRRDKLTRLIYWHLGDRVSSIDQGELTDTGAILPFTVKWVRTDYRTRLDPSRQYSRMLSELVRDPERNRLICIEAAQQARSSGGIPLVLTDRKEHCRVIAQALDRDHGIAADVLIGDLSEKARKKVVDRLNNGEGKTLVATSQLVGEGFDLPAVGSILLAAPMRFRGRLQQAIGRGLRPAPGQDHAEVVDFLDDKVGVLKAAAKSRMKTYHQLGGKFN